LAKNGKVSICDNMAPNGNFEPLLAKHTENFNLVRSLPVFEPARLTWAAPLIWSHRRLHLITFTENHCPAVESGIVNRSELETLRRNCRSARCGQISSHLLR
jgi:hypothetical protein